MQKITQPSRDHTQFTALCSGLEEWEPLPEVDAAPAPEINWVDSEGELQTALDGQILAGLVSPC
jgi:hypothetical protein